MCRMSAWYYNMFIILMSVFMGMGGILLTALAYRPKQISEDWWDWTNRFYESGELRTGFREESLGFRTEYIHPMFLESLVPCVTVGQLGDFFII